MPRTASSPRGGTGHEHRAPRRLRPRLEARLGAARLGRTTALLDSYEPERRPVAEHNVARSADPDGLRSGGRAGTAASTSASASRTSGCERPAAASRRSICSGPGLTLFTGAESAAWEQSAAAGRAPAAGRGPAPRPGQRPCARRRPGGALLVRPDGAPAAWWPSAGEGPSSPLSRRSTPPPPAKPPSSRLRSGSCRTTRSKTLAALRVFRPDLGHECGRFDRPAIRTYPSVRAAVAAAGRL